jgi:hypothetical protein
MPMVIMVSPDDRALGPPAIAGQRTRVGALDITDPAVQAAAQQSNVVLIDISAVGASSRQSRQVHPVGFRLPRTGRGDATGEHIHRGGRLCLDLDWTTPFGTFARRGRGSGAVE